MVGVGMSSSRTMKVDSSINSAGVEGAIRDRLYFRFNIRGLWIRDGVKEAMAARRI